MKNKILIVEDEKFYSQLLAHELRLSNFDVRIANNGQEALDLLEIESFDLVLLDMIMPILSGFDMLDKLQKKQMKLRVFALTNLAQEADKEKLAKLGVQEYIVKADIPIYELVKKIQRALVE